LIYEDIQGKNRSIVIGQTVGGGFQGQTSCPATRDLTLDTSRMNALPVERNFQGQTTLLNI
ncbi:hypothetical protein QYM36_005915, partial [Artemia franciscana]